MDKITECYIKLNGHYPSIWPNIYYKGVAINKDDFAVVKKKRMQMVNHIYLQQCNVERASPKTSKHSDAFKLECIKASQGLTTKQRKAMCESKGIDEQNLYRFKKDLSEGRVVDPSKYMIHRVKERYKND